MRAAKASRHRHGASATPATPDITRTLDALSRGDAVAHGFEFVDRSLLGAPGVESGEVIGAGVVVKGSGRAHVLDRDEHGEVSPLYIAQWILNWAGSRSAGSSDASGMGCIPEADCCRAAEEAQVRRALELANPAGSLHSSIGSGLITQRSLVHILPPLPM